jgi:hypothetical protein
VSIGSTKASDNAGVVKVKLGRIVQQICFKIALIMVVAAGLSACATQQSMRRAVGTSDQTPIAPNMTPLQYSWDTNYSAILMPPIEIRDKALIACTQRGFDRAYMQSLSLNEDKATAYFTCRGSDQ